MFRKLIILGCLSAASFFLGCSQIGEPPSPAAGEPDMYVASEMALLMRKMYEDNLEIKKELEDGKIPESFPRDFYTIHQAVITDGMVPDRTTFDGLARQYIANMEKITAAKDPRKAKIAYNEMVLTCAACHQIYCQGPLPKIRRMKIAVDE